MKKKIPKLRSHCPINFAQEVFGDRWSLLIIRDLMFKGKKTYGEMLRSEERISTNILAVRLEKLESWGIINKSVDKNNRSKINYSLTQKGIDLMPMLLEMMAWSAQYDEDTSTPRAFVKRLRGDRQALIEELSKKIS